MTSPAAPSEYDPTEGMNACERVTYYVDDAKWRIEEGGPADTRSVERAREALRDLTKAMREDSDHIHADALKCRADLRAYIQRFLDSEPVIKVVDGDGDGWVYDGTPKKRPATPAEMAAGARLRARQGKKAAPARAGAKKAPAGKKAAPKNEYEKRVAKFERAIAQAVRSGDKKKIKEVHDLIGQDFILKKPERDMLQRELADAAAGKAKVVEAKPAAKAPAKKAAAKVPAKAAAGKKAAPPAKKPERTDYGEMKGEDGKPILPPKPKGAIREAAAKKPALDLQRRIAPHTAAPAGRPKVSPQSELKKRIALAAVKRAMPEVAGADDKKIAELRDVLNNARTAGVPEAELVPFRAAIIQRAGELADEHSARQKSFERRAAAKKPTPKKMAPGARGPGRQPTIESVETTHGGMTRAWMRHAERDIKNARDFRTLKGRMTQVNNLRNAKRISEREANLLKTLIRQRLRQLGLDENGKAKAPTWRERVQQRVASMKKPTTFGNLPSKGPETKAYEALQDAKNIADVEAAVDAAEEAKDRGELAPEKLSDIAREAFRVKRRLQSAEAKQKSFERKARENADFKAKEQAKEVLDRIRAAKVQTDMTAIQNDMRGPQFKPLRDWLRQSAQKQDLDALNAAFKARAQAIREGRVSPKTVQPKMPPGAARDRAKRNLPSEWKQRISAAQRLSDVEQMMSELEKVPVDEIDKDDFNEIAAALNDRMAELDGAEFDHEPFKGVLGKKPTEQKAVDLLAVAYDPRQINGILKAYEEQTGKAPSQSLLRAVERRHEQVEAKIAKASHRKLSDYGMPSRSEAGTDNSAEAMLALDKHFRGGGGIEDAPNVGLWNYLQVSDRFNVTPKSGVKGITPKFIVDDKETGDRWWVKADWTHMAVVEHGAMKEQWGGYLMEGMGLADAPRVKMGQTGEVNDDPGVGKFMLVRDAGQAMFGKDDVPVQDAFYSNMHVDAVRAGAGAGGYVRLHLLDYVMDNNDRHGGNVMGVVGPSGAHIPLLDFGLGMGYWRHKVDVNMSPLAYLRDRARKDSVGDAILRDPESNKHMAMVLKELRKVRVQAIVDQMIQNGQDPAQARQWGESMQNRIDKLLALTPDQLVQIFSRN